LRLGRLRGDESRQPKTDIKILWRIVNDSQPLAISVDAAAGGSRPPVPDIRSAS
jgi:hypothetical protein